VEWLSFWTHDDSPKDLLPPSGNGQSWKMNVDRESVLRQVLRKIHSDCGAEDVHDGDDVA
jgi:hypothetical protein